MALPLLFAASSRAQYTNLYQVGGNASAASASSTLMVRGLGRGTVPLDGKWQFKTGDNPAWARPGFDDSSWERIGVNDTYGNQGHFGYSGYAWYRLHVDFVPADGAKMNLALILAPIGGGSSWGGPYEVYWNGAPIGRVGRMPPNPDWGFRSPPASFGLPGGNGVLAIRTWKPRMQFVEIGTEGGIYIPPLAGSSEAVADKLGELDHTWLSNRQFYFDENLLYAILGLLGLLAWTRNRGQRVLLWMSVFALTQPLHVLLFNTHLGLSFRLTVVVDQLLQSVQSLSLWFLLLYLLELDRDARLRRWTRGLGVIAVCCALLDGVAVSGDWSSAHGVIYQVADGVLAFPISLIRLFPIVLIAFAIHKKISLANWLVAVAASLVEMIAMLRINSLEAAHFTHTLRVYHIIQTRLFAIHGNFFDAQNSAVTLLLIAIVFAVYRYSAEQSERKGALEQEFKSAQELQRILIPESLPPLAGYAVTSAYRPAQEVGGDFFQLIAQADGSALLLLGDVSGKGLKAAMTVSLLVGAVRTLAETTPDPAEILAGLNRRLEGRLQSGFVTCLVLRLDPAGECSIANAGHLSPYRNSEEIGLPPALPLGVVSDVIFETTSFYLAIGDRLTLYTDGLLEARSPTGELYGFERVRELFATHPDAHAATEAAVAFGQDDDITVLTVTRLAVGAESTMVMKAPELISAV